MLVKELNSDNEEKCTFCGENEAGGAWMGKESIVFCCGLQKMGSKNGVKKMGSSL